MIYCVIPEPMADELFEKLSTYYADDPNVTVIIDRRKAARRDRGATEEGEARRLRDRRRRSVPGEFPALETE